MSRVEDRVLELTLVRSGCDDRLYPLVGHVTVKRNT